MYISKATSELFQSLKLVVVSGEKDKFYVSKR